MSPGPPVFQVSSQKMMKEGDTVAIRVPVPSTRRGKKTHALWDNHYWGPAIIVTLSGCGRYAKIKARISWQKGNGTRETIIPTKYLRLARRN